MLKTTLQTPIEDSMSKGFEIESEILEPQDIDAIKDFYYDNKFDEKIRNCLERSSLYGGAGLIIAMDRDMRQRNFGLRKGEEFDLVPVDRWQLNFTNANIYY